MPRKDKHKKNKLQDELQDQKFHKSKWAKVVDQAADSDSQQQGNAQELYAKKKQVFTYDFSGEQILYEQKPEKPQLKLEDRFTPQQIQRMKEIAEKQRLQKQAKQQIKRQKRQQKKKQKAVQKEIQRKIKQQQQKQQEQLKMEIKKSQGKSGTKMIPLVLMGFLLLMFIMQYQKQIYAKFEHFRVNSQQDLYASLETDSGATDRQLRLKYKKLVMKYHPDKNPDCSYCQQKFDSIMRAWEVLGNQQKRKSYDQNSGFVSQIKSKSLTLTRATYHTIIQPSQELWVVEVYDSTNEYCHRFASLWQQTVQDFSGFARFARVDVWHQSNMLSYLPYKFQIFPGIYMIKRGHNQICHLDFNSPIQSISKCIQEEVVVPEVTPITSLTQMLLKQDERGMILGLNLKLSPRFNLIFDKYSDRFKLFRNASESKNLISIVRKNKQGNNQVLKQFAFKTKSKDQYRKFQQFLLSSFIQEKSFCQIKDQCQQYSCVLLLNKNVQPSYASNKNYRIVRPLEWQEEDFRTQIQKLKNKTEMVQNFDIGIYQAGQIQLGYWEQIQDLNPEQGEIIDLQCQWKSWSDKIIQGIVSIKQKLFQS